MSSAPFKATTENGEPVVFDTVARVTYYGYTSMQKAIDHASELNQEEKKLLNFGAEYFELVDYYNHLGEVKHV